MRRIITCLVVIFFALSAAPAVDALKLHPDNGRYFQFRGQPLVLVTSGEHYGAVFNLDFDYVVYLNELQAKGLNYTRLFTGPVVGPYPSDLGPDGTIAPRSGRYLCAWARSTTPGYAGGGNKFNLDQWDAAYFTRLKDFVTKAGDRGIVVELTMFSTLYFDDSVWNVSPFHPNNNVNGTALISRNAVHVMGSPYLPRQEALVRKLSAEMAAYDNVFFEICNEPYWEVVSDDWQRQITSVLAGAEALLPANQRHLIARNIANAGEGQAWGPQGALSLSDYPNISIFNYHYARPPYIVERQYHLNRPIGDDETGFDGNGDSAYRKEGWNFILAGGALFNNLDPSFTTAQENGTWSSASSVHGGSPALRTSLGALRRFIHSLPFTTMAPNNALITGGNPGTARCLAKPGSAYGVYLTGGSQANLQLTLAAGTWSVEWIDTKTGTVAKNEVISQATTGARTLVSPSYSEDIALRILPNGAQPSTISLSVSTQTVGEGIGTLTVTATRTGNTSGTVGVTYATANGNASAGSDYAVASGTFSWAAGDSADKSIVIAIADDGAVEADETLSLNISTPTGGALLGIATQGITIVDNDGTVNATLQNGSFESDFANWSVATIDANPAAVAVTTTQGTTDGAKAAAFNDGNRVGNARLAQAVGTVSGQAYTLAFDYGTYGGGSGSTSIRAEVVGKTLLASQEATATTPGSYSASATTFARRTLSFTADGTAVRIRFIDLTSATASSGKDGMLDRITFAASAAPGTIALTTASQNVGEGAGSVTITARRSGGNSGAVGVSYATSGTPTPNVASAGSDYVAASGSLSWADGDSADKTVTVTILDDGVDEADEIFALTLSAATGGASLGSVASQTITILDNDQPASGSLVNGSFENDLAGWTVSASDANPAAFFIATTQGTTDGVKAVAFNDGNRAGNAIISQSVAVVAGQTYALAFDFGAFGANRASVLRAAVIGGTTLATQDFTATGPGSFTASATTFARRTLIFTADGSTVTIRFTDLTSLSASNAQDGMLDNVTIEQQLADVSLVNGSFENDLAGWTASASDANPAAVAISTTQGSTDGTKAAAFNDGNRAGNATISQSVAVVAGQTYTLAFDFGAFGANRTSMLRAAVIGGTTLATQDFTATGPGSFTASATTFTRRTLTFTADGGTVTIRFTDLTSLSASNAQDGMLDDITIEPAAPTGVGRIAPADSIRDDGILANEAMPVGPSVSDALGGVPRT